jgi:hypothetical protein
MTDSADLVSHMPRRTFLGNIISVSAATLVLAGCSRGSSSYKTADGVVSSKGEAVRTSEQLDDEFILQAAESLLALGEESHGGLRFKSEVQGDNYQTDRDVGAAGVGMGFLTLASRYPEDSRWLDAAVKTAAWLTAVSKPGREAGRYWNDYVNDDETSTDIYTSFDDGVIGIGDFFWQLYEQTNDEAHKTMALESLEWMFSKAQPIDDGAIQYQWDITDRGSQYSMGMGMGVAGIVHTFASYEQRLADSDPEMAAKCREYIDETLQYMSDVRTELASNVGDSADARALPETGVVGQDGDTEMDSGYLSGAAGAAFMYLKLYETYKDESYLAQADKLFNWLEDTTNGPMVKFGDGAVAWDIALDPQGGNTPRFATGFEEGSAGIGWVYLQAYNVTKQEKYLTMAKGAADWLLRVAIRDQDGGMSWHEDQRPVNELIHANLNNGSAGIGMFFEDLALASSDGKYHTVAEGALTWLKNTAIHDGKHAYWRDNSGYADGNSGPTGPYNRDPSWHWGSAGIIAFMVRMRGGRMDIPGEQPALKVV